MSTASRRSDEIRKRVAAKWQELARITRDVCEQWPCRNSLGHAAMAQFALEVEGQARRAQHELEAAPEQRRCDMQALESSRLHVIRCADANAPSDFKKGRRA